MFGDEALHDVQLDRIFSRNAVFFAVFSDSVFKPLIFWQTDANLMAFGSGNPPLPLKFTPGNVVAFGADQPKDIGLAPVFTHQRGRQPKTPPGLDFSGDAKDRGW